MKKAEIVRKEMFEMTKREKVLLGTSITGFTGFLITGYYMIAYKQAFDILVEEQKASYDTMILNQERL